MNGFKNGSTRLTVRTAPPNGRQGEPSEPSTAPPLPLPWLRNGASGLRVRHDFLLVVDDPGGGVTVLGGIDGPLMRGYATVSPHCARPVRRRVHRDVHHRRRPLRRGVHLPPRHLGHPRGSRRVRRAQHPAHPDLPPARELPAATRRAGCCSASRSQPWPSRQPGSCGRSAASAASISGYARTAWSTGLGGAPPVGPGTASPCSASKATREAPWQRGKLPGDPARHRLPRLRTGRRSSGLAR
ncbi:hypothetical protein GA0115234_108811 [Streptomyces sp. DvalAA-43]|nr:hypothetical protein GA0115234_108811 [Streptomyces sp. DvalAA-43]